MTEATRLCSENLSLRFGSTQVLDTVSIELNAGWTAIVGPNGAGKSTLLRCLAGLLRPDRGRVTIGGQDLASLSERQRGRQIAWLAQQAEPGTDLTTREVASLGRLPHTGLFRALSGDDEQAVSAALAASQALDWEHRILLEQSGGERQRTLIARALAVQAPVLLLDEPTSHLDPPHQVNLVRLMQTLARTGIVVSVLHDLNLALRADRIIVMAAGRVQAGGSPGDPGLQAALTGVFDNAIEIRRLDGHWFATARI